MSDDPGRILARTDYDGDVDGQWIDADAPRPHSFGRYFSEYLRADLATRREADAYRAGLEAAAKVADHDAGRQAADAGVAALWQKDLMPKTAMLLEAQAKAARRIAAAIRKLKDNTP
jgi:hypothetical protein